MKYRIVFKKFRGCLEYMVQFKLIFVWLICADPHDRCCYAVYSRLKDAQNAVEKIMNKTKTKKFQVIKTYDSKAVSGGELSIAEE
jgi:hypothetical protein